MRHIYIDYAERPIAPWHPHAVKKNPPPRLHGKINPRLKIAAEADFGDVAAVLTAGPTSLGLVPVTPLGAQKLDGTGAGDEHTRKDYYRETLQVVGLGNSDTDE